MPAVGRRARGRAPGPAGGAGQPAGLGTGRALRGRGADRARRGRRDRDRPHRRRPGRDDPLPAGVLAEPPGAARHAASRRPAGPAAARPHPRADHLLLRGARARLARRRDQRGGGLRPQPAPRRPAPGPCRDPSGGRPERAPHRGAAPRRGGGARRPGRRRDRRLGRVGRATRSHSSGSGSCLRPCGGSSSSSSPTAPPAVRFPAPPAMPRRSPGCGGPAPRCSTSAPGCARSSSGACCGPSVDRFQQ